MEVNIRQIVRFDEFNKIINKDAIFENDVGEGTFLVPKENCYKYKINGFLYKHYGEMKMKAEWTDETIHEKETIE